MRREPCWMGYMQGNYLMLQKGSLKKLHTEVISNPRMDVISIFRAKNFTEAWKKLHVMATVREVKNRLLNSKG